MIRRNDISGTISMKGYRCEICGFEWLHSAFEFLPRQCCGEGMAPPEKRLSIKKDEIDLAIDETMAEIDLAIDKAIAEIDLAIDKAIAEREKELYARLLES